MQASPSEPNEKNSGGSANSAVTEALLSSLHWLYDQIGARKQDTNATTRSTEVSSTKQADADEAVDAIIRWAAAQAGFLGFATNLGGILTLPIAIPANVAGVSALQIHMVQEIARARGYDLQSDQVKTLTIACLAGGAVLDVLKDFGISVGVKLSERMILQITGPTLVRINQAVGFRLLTKAGSNGMVNFAKFVPFMGGLVSGTVDGFATAGIGAVAKRIFVSRNPISKPDDEPFDLGTPAPPAPQPSLTQS